MTATTATKPNASAFSRYLRKHFNIITGPRTNPHICYAVSRGRADYVTLEVNLRRGDAVDRRMVEAIADEVNELGDYHVEVFGDGLARITRP